MTHAKTTNVLFLENSWHQLFLLFEKIAMDLIDIDCGHFDIKTP